MSQFSIFDSERQLEKIHQLNSFLPKLKSLINFEMFRPVIDQARPPKPQPNGGRPPYDNVLIAKVLILKYLYQLSDEDTELQIRDRLSFHDFLGLTNSDHFPDARTIWLEQLKQAGCERKLFDMFNKLLSDNGFEAKGGSIVDAQFVEVPKQRNSREENEQIKKGETPERFERNPNILRHKDLDARWTKKNDEVHYGYKDHVKQDVEHKFIRDDSVTSAEVHDSNEFLSFFPDLRCGDKDKKLPPYRERERVFGDSAYAHHESELRRRGYRPRLCWKGYRNHPLSAVQKLSNRPFL